MSKVGFSATSCLLLLFLFPQVLLAQEQNAPAQRDPKSIERFYEAADHPTEKLLLKVLRFTAPYEGSFQMLTLDREGNAFSAAGGTDWAIHAAEAAKLDDMRFGQIKGMLTNLTLASDPLLPEPQPGQLHIAVVLNDGKAFKRYEFNDAAPAPVQAILEIIREGLRIEAEIQNEELLLYHKLIEDTYGDWQNKSGVAVVTDNPTHHLKDVQGLLLSLNGHRNRPKPATSTEVSIYNALVFYPQGVVTGGAGGGNWGGDPSFNQGVSWIIPQSSTEATEAEIKTLEITYQAVDATVCIGGKLYHLADGNMLVIRMGENWKPVAHQIRSHLDEKTTEQRVLDQFKSLLKEDGFIQQLELY